MQAQEQQEHGEAEKPAPKRRRKAKAKPRRSAPPKGEEWRSRGRLALIELEPTVERMLITGCGRAVVMSYCVSRGATEQQVADLVRGIKSRWAAVHDDTRPQRIAEFAAQLDAAIYDAWNRPVIMNTPEGKVPLRNADGHAVVSADHAALTKYLKLKAELFGLNAPSKHVVLHGEVPSAAALMPVERQAQITQLLERRAAALALSAPGAEKSRADIVDTESERVYK